MPNVLVIGATRGLGASLAHQYAEREHTNVYGTARGEPKDAVHPRITWLTDVDVSTSDAGKSIVSSLKATMSHQALDIVIVTAGYFGKESFDEPDFDAQLDMYKISAIGPVFIAHSLVQEGLLNEGSKLILVSSEAGSITLRHESEGGGMFGHHGSKAAMNMTGRLLSFDLKPKGITVGMLHPGFMRTEMTKGVGFDKFWDSGGAVTPEEAAKSMITFIDTFGIDQTGSYWAPRGPGDIGTAEQTIGKRSNLSTPLQLPW